jgi:hypothetical protein
VVAGVALWRSLAGVLILMPFVLTCTLHVPAVPGQGRPRGVRLSAAHVFRGQPFSVL